MTSPRSSERILLAIRCRSWLLQPLSSSWCVLGWLFATVVFVGMATLLGGPVDNDASVSVYPAWALAHGSLACAFAPAQFSYPSPAPLYPLLSGALVALFRIGHNVAFPPLNLLGPHCSTAIAAMYRWSFHASALTPTLRMGYVGWLVVLAGLVALLRVSGRGRQRWEPLAVLMAASAPPLYMCLLEYFHPQDLVAFGLALAGLACVLTGRWTWAGFLLGLAVTCHQFTLLVLVPLLVVAPRRELSRLFGAAVATVLVVAVPLIMLTSGRAFTSVAVGTGALPDVNTVLDQMPIHGSVLVTLSRFLPIAISALISWWAARRLGSLVLDPVPMVSLVATSLALRLVFEVNLWGYYFMAVSIALIALDVIRGRIRVTFVVWLAVVSVISMRGGLTDYPANRAVPVWLWQLVLVPSAVALASGPLVSLVRDRERHKQLLIDTL